MPRAYDPQDDLLAAQEAMGGLDYDTLDLARETPEALSTWQGAGEQLKGLLRPSAGAGRALLLAAGAPLAIWDRIQETGSKKRYGRMFGQEVITPTPTNVSEPYFREVVDEIGSDAVDYWTPDARTQYGAAARVTGVVSNVVGAVPQMIGLPSVFLGTAALDPATELVRQGVDPATAGAVGGANLAANAIGLRMPAAFGTSLFTRAATGAGTNLGLGVAADAASAGALQAGGYDDQAAAYDVTDPYARGLDVLLGVAFGVRAQVEAGTSGRLPLPDRDAVLAARNADHFQRRTLPGTPATPRAESLHQDALSTAIRQVLAGERVDVSAVIRAEDFALPPAAASSPQGFERAVERVLRDEGGYVDDPADRGGETNFGISKRANPDIDVANLTREQAREIYRERYWNAIDGDRLPPELQEVAFDAAVNQGVGWTRRALEQAGGDVQQFIALREARYREIVAADPSQAKFLRGWLNRLGRYRETSDAGRALRERLVADPEQLARDYAALEDSDGGRILNTDTARELAPEYLADRTRSADVHEAASDFVKTLYESKLARSTPDGFEPTVLFTAGGTGAGKTSALNAAGDAIGRPEIIYDTNMNTLSSAIEKIEAALAAGREVDIAYVYRDPVDALTAGAIPRAQRQAEKFGTGRTVPIEEHARTHVGVRPTIEALAERYRDDPRVRILAIDNSQGQGKQKVVDLASLPRVEENQLRERLQQALEEARAAGLDERLYRGFAGRGPAPAADGGARPDRSLEPVAGGSRGRDGAVAGDGRGSGRGAAQGDSRVSVAETPVDAAQRVAAESPDFMVADGFDADGNPVYRPIADVLADIQAERARAESDARAFGAAANCALRRGS